MLAMKASTRSTRVLAVLLALLVAAPPVPFTHRRLPRFQPLKNSSASRWAPIASLPTGTSCTSTTSCSPRAPNRVKLVELGKSSEGRPFIALFISSPANLAKLEQLPADQRAGSPIRAACPEAEVKKLSPTARPSRSRASRCTRPKWRRRRRPPSSSTTA